MSFRRDKRKEESKSELKSKEWSDEELLTRPDPDFLKDMEIEELKEVPESFEKEASDLSWTDNVSTKNLVVFPTVARDFEDRVLMVTAPGETTGPVEAYLVPRNSVNFDVKGGQPIRIDTNVESVYDWTQTVDNLLPDRETIVRNVVLSFLRAGVLNPSADLQFRRQAFRTAFPYKLEDGN